MPCLGNWSIGILKQQASGNLLFIIINFRTIDRIFFLEV